MSWLTRPTTDALLDAMWRYGASPLTAFRARQVADALTDRYDLDAVPALVEMLGAESSIVRRNAANVQGAWGNTPTVQAALREVLVNGNGAQINAVLRLVPPTGDLEAIPLIAARLPITPPHAQPQLVRALGEYRHPAALPAILGARRFRNLNNNILWALTLIPGDASLYSIMDLLDEGRSPQMSQWAAAALGRLGDPRAVPTLALMVDHSNPLIRRAAIQALGEIGGDEAVRVLVWWLERGTPRDVDAVLTAIRSSGDTSTVPNVAALLGDMRRTHPGRHGVRRHHAAYETLIVLGQADLVRAWARRHPLRWALAGILGAGDRCARMNPAEHFLLFLVGACLFVFGVLYWLAGYGFWASLWRALIPPGLLVGVAALLGTQGLVMLAQQQLKTWRDTQQHRRKRQQRRAKR